MKQNTSIPGENQDLSHYNVTLDQKKQTLNLVVKQVKKLSEASYVGLYLYNHANSDYVLGNVDENKQFEVINHIDPYDPLIHHADKGTHVYNASKLLHPTLHMEAFLVALSSTTPIKGYLLFVFNKGHHNLTQLFYNNLTSLTEDTSSLLRDVSSNETSIEKANKYELMYRVTKKFHSTMNTNAVLAEIVETIRSIYPELKCNLFLSKNHQEDTDLPIKELIYNNDFADKASVQAFLTGEVKIEAKYDKQKVSLYAPLHGKQGVYGVLQLTTFSMTEFPSEDIEFVKLLANTAGNALENAQLYQQSNQLIQDLQLINTFTQKLNATLNLAETINFIKKQIQECFQAEEIGFVLLDQEGRLELQEHSTAFFYKDEAKQVIDDIATKSRIEKDALFVGDYAKKHPNSSLNLHAVMAMPMLQSKQVIGLVIILHHEPYFFSFDQFKLIKSIVQHATLAFVNILLREQLEKSVITDYLTKLYSREYLDERCKVYIKSEERGSFLLIDLDDFKGVNDTYGHDVGDALLIQVANIIRSHLNEYGFAARWGGEELVVYLRNSTPVAGERLANKLVKEIAMKTNPSITASIGIAHWSKAKPDNLQSIFDRADHALYEAKRLGKNQTFQIS